MEIQEEAGTRYSPAIADMFSDRRVREDITHILYNTRRNDYRETYSLLKELQERG